MSTTLRPYGVTMREVTDFYETARLNARKFLLESKIAPQRCLLAGHDLEEGQEIAVCVICDVTGCPDCLDVHSCLDYEVVL